MRLIKHADCGYSILDLGMLDLARINARMVVLGLEPLTVAVECAHSSGTCQVSETNVAEPSVCSGSAATGAGPGRAAGGRQRQGIPRARWPLLPLAITD
jgi:hypothetical protein